MLQGLSAHGFAHSLGALSLLHCSLALSTCELHFGEDPLAVQNLGTRTIEAHHVVPARHGRQAVGDRAVAAAELDGDRAVVAFLRGDAVERICIVLVLLKMTVGGVDDDRPEGVNGDILNVELVDGGTIVPARRDGEIDGVLVCGSVSWRRSPESLSRDGLDIRQFPGLVEQ